MEAKFDVHDRNHFEIKLDLELEQARKVSYFMDAFLFVPRSLNISPANYSKDRFYNVLQKHIRFKTPQILLNKITDSSFALSPLNRLLKSMSRIQEGSRDSKDIESVINEIKLLGAISRRALRDFSHSLVTDLNHIALDESPKFQRYENLHNLAQSFISDTQTLQRNVIDLRGAFCLAAIPPKIRDSYRFLDEFLSLNIDEYFTEVLSAIDHSLRHGENLGDLRLKLQELVLFQIQHRQDMSYPSVIKPQSDNAAMIYRRGILKKFFSSALHLQVQPKEQSGITQLLFGLAAGVSMLFATIVAIFAQSRYANNTMVFVTLLVISYIFKDRIKDWLKLIFTRGMTRFFADGIHIIRDPATTRTIGTYKEAFRFLDPSSVPDEVKNRRNADNLTSVDEDGKPERILLYEKHVQIFPEQISKFHARKRDINDIIRVGIQDFIAQADNPLVTTQHLDPVTKKIHAVNCSRFYHINMVFQFRVSTSPEHEHSWYERIRLIVDQNGIVRLEKVSA